MTVPLRITIHDGMEENTLNFNVENQSKERAQWIAAKFSGLKLISVEVGEEKDEG